MKSLTGILLLAVASAQAPAQPATRDVPYATTPLAWLALMCLPRLRWTSTILPVVMPAALAIVYVLLVAGTLPWSDGGFSSLAGVSALFDNPWILLAGWTHYLAFDLFVGGWEVRSAQS